MVLGSDRLRMQSDMMSGSLLNIQPASWDITLGDTLMVERRPTWKQRVKREKLIAGVDQWEPYPFYQHSHSNPYLLAPGEFVLACTEEEFDLPYDVAAEFKIRSTAARMGVNNLLATWADPGWHGSVLTLELVNTNRYHYVPIWPGATYVGQMVFHSVEGNASLYDGRYNNDQTVAPSKPDKQ